MFNYATVNQLACDGTMDSPTYHINLQKQIATTKAIRNYIKSIFFSIYVAK